MSADELDGVRVAPDYHKVLFENDYVRVLEVTVVAGDTTPLHTHLTPTVSYVLSGSQLLRRDENAEVLLDTRENPDFILPRVLWADSVPKHTLENVGRDDVVVIAIEIKSR